MMRFLTFGARDGGMATETPLAAMVLPTLEAPSPWPRNVKPRRPSGRDAAADLSSLWVSAIAPLFDQHYYVRRYADVPKANHGPVAHYVHTGWRLGYDPAPWFSTNAYLDINDDVRETDIPPFVHYVLYGRAEGRTIQPTADVKVDCPAPAPPAPVVTKPTQTIIDGEYVALRRREDMNWDRHIGAYIAQRLGPPL